MDRRSHIQQLALVLGYSITFGTSALIFESCKKDAGKAPTDSKTDNVFSADQRKLLAELTDTILPKTETLGALDTHTPDYIAKLVNEVYNDADKAEFIKGLSEIEDQCKRASGKTFTESNKAEREAFLTKLDDESPKFPPVMWGIVLIKNTAPVGFFRKLKAATLLAYFTSQELSEYNKQKVSHG